MPKSKQLQSEGKKIPKQRFQVKTDMVVALMEWKQCLQSKNNKQYKKCLCHLWHLRLVTLVIHAQGSRLWLKPWLPSWQTNLSVSKKKWQWYSWNAVGIPRTWYQEMYKLFHLKCYTVANSPENLLFIFSSDNDIKSFQSYNKQNRNKVKCWLAWDTLVPHDLPT